MERDSRMTFGLVVMAVVMESMWGMSFIATKYLLNAGLNPSQIYVLRFGIAYTCLLAITRTHLRLGNIRDELVLFMCGLSGGSLYFITENTALKHTLVSNVGLIMAICPLLTALLIKLIFRNEKISKGVIIGSVVAFVGVVFVIYNSSFELKVSPFGDFLALLGALGWAIYTIGLRRFDDGHYPVMVVTRKVFFYGIITSIPFAIFMPSNVGPDIFFDKGVLFNLLFLGLGASMSSYLLWNYLVKRVGAVKISNFLYICPLVTLMASVFMLGEVLTWVGYVGCFMIMLGVVLGEKLKC